jgi:AcrR family transcriptional regulator
MPKKKASPPAADPAQRLIDAALVLAARQRWSRTSLADIAGEAGLPLHEAYVQFRSKAAILDGLMRRVDAAALEGVDRDAAVIGGHAKQNGEAPAEPASAVRDRLFDTLMRRFDILSPYRDGLRGVLRDGIADPGSLVAGAALLRSMAWMLEASGISAAGWRGRLRVPALAGLYLMVFRVFLDDDSPDLARTMATLDRQLRRGERVLGLTSKSLNGA